MGKLGAMLMVIDGTKKHKKRPLMWGHCVSSIKC